MSVLDHCDKYWYIYEADDIDLDDAAWVFRSSTGVDWEKSTPEQRAEDEHMARTGWDGTGDWYEREQDQGPNKPLYPVVQAVKHCGTGKQHLLSLVPFPERGEPRFVFYLSYMPFFFEPAERDERYQSSEGVQ